MDANYAKYMASLKEEEATLQKSLVNLKKSLADTKLELENKRGELDVATREKVAIERYLDKVKPGCDFITTNFDKREEIFDRRLLTSVQYWLEYFSS